MPKAPKEPKQAQTAKVSTPSIADAANGVVELTSLKTLIESGTLAVAGEMTVGHGFLTKIKNVEGDGWTRDVLWIVNRANTAICRNYPRLAPMPKHKEPVQVVLTANTKDSATFPVKR